MSQFNYADYQNVIAQAQNGDGNKVGYFKLKEDGDEALVRFNCASVEDLQFASVHTLQSNGKWMRVSCLNPLGNYADSCPLCNAVKAGNKAISKAGKKVYLQMMCAYKDKTTGQFSEAIPVIWERPASFSRDIANKLKDYGDLKDTVLKITRNGAAGDMKTTYGIDFVPLYNKPELVPNDFSAFASFNIAKHSYWEKSLDEINTFMATGAFPEANGSGGAAAPAAPAGAINPYANMAVNPYANIPAAPVAPAPAFVPAAPVAPTAPYAAAPTAPVMPAHPAATQAVPVAPTVPQFTMPTAPATPTAPAVYDGTAAPARVPAQGVVPGAVPPAVPAAGDRPVRNFQGFSF